MTGGSADVHAAHTSEGASRKCANGGTEMDFIHNISTNISNTLGDWTATLANGWVKPASGCEDDKNFIFAPHVREPHVPAPSPSPSPRSALSARAESPAASVASARTPRGSRLVSASRVDSPPFFVPEEDVPSTTAKRLCTPTEPPCSCRSATPIQSESPGSMSLRCGNSGLVNSSIIQPSAAPSSTCEVPGRLFQDRNQLSKVDQALPALSTPEKCAIEDRGVDEVTGPSLSAREPPARLRLGCAAPSPPDLSAADTLVSKNSPDSLQNSPEMSTCAAKISSGQDRAPQEHSDSNAPQVQIPAISQAHLGTRRESLRHPVALFSEIWRYAPTGNRQGTIICPLLLAMLIYYVLFFRDTPSAARDKRFATHVPTVPRLSSAADTQPRYLHPEIGRPAALSASAASQVLLQTAGVGGVDGDAQNHHAPLLPPEASLQQIRATFDTAAVDFLAAEETEIVDTSPSSGHAGALEPYRSAANVGDKTAAADMHDSTLAGAARVARTPITHQPEAHHYHMHSAPADVPSSGVALAAEGSSIAVEECSSLVIGEHSISEVTGPSEGSSMAVEERFASVDKTHSTSMEKAHGALSIDHSNLTAHTRVREPHDVPMEGQLCDKNVLVNNLDQPSRASGDDDVKKSATPEHAAGDVKVERGSLPARCQRQQAKDFEVEKVLRHADQPGCAAGDVNVKNIDQPACPAGDVDVKVERGSLLSACRIQSGVEGAQLHESRPAEDGKDIELGAQKQTHFQAHTHTHGNADNRSQDWNQKRRQLEEGGQELVASEMGEAKGVNEASYQGPLAPRGEEQDETPARESQSNEFVVLLLALAALSGCYPCYSLARMLYSAIDSSCGAVGLSAPAPRMKVPKESRSRLDGKVSCASGTSKQASSQPACVDRGSEDVSECFRFCSLGSQTHRALLCAACSISVGNGGNRVK